MVTFAPLAIFLGAAATAALMFFTFWEFVQTNATESVKKSTTILDRAGFRRKPEEIVITWVVITAALWIVALLFFRPSIIVGLLILPVAAAVAAGIYAGVVRHRLRTRTEAFLNQLETVLRLMGSGLRSGLGLQQTLALVSEEMKDPARYEFARVLGQTNIGVSIHDALDDLADRVQSNETTMMARVIRVNAQTGGDLARVLEQLANTIKERRRMRRKISSLTAEGRIGATIL
ncbi:MAG TPA: type II secretion system F family protein, partial [Candidatus Baltobacteraceae bacterium]|nr:type II secretion system F family protein [Candidatus Baltobacteraceae bacterium]